MTHKSSEEARTTELPLFPLSNTVLFPGMVLPLYIFEPRYRVMINRCIQLKRPFGICLIDEGPEVGGVAEPHQVGTVAEITEVERNPDGTMNIEVLGIERFIIQEITQREPYLLAHVSQYPMTNDGAYHDVVLDLEDGLRKYIDTVVASLDVEFQIDEAHKGAIALAYLTAILLPLPSKDKQQLLEMPVLSDMLAKEKSLLRREQMLLDAMVSRKQSNMRDNQSFSEN